MGSFRTAAKPVVTQSSQDWHARPAEDAFLHFGTSEHGLSRDAVENRRAEYGQNAFTEVRQKSIWQNALTQLRSPLAIVLIVAFFLTLTLQEYIDAGVIAFALLIAVAIGILQEGKASHAFKTLAQSQVRQATVIRAGKKHLIEAAELVPGDIVELSDGVQVPADLRLIRTKKLKLNEAALTGEWLAVRKSPEEVSVGVSLAERSSMAWMGTFVSEGSGLGVVVATGDATVVGSLAQDVQDVVEQATPLQLEVEKVSRFMLYTITGFVTVIFVVGIWQGYPLSDMVLTAIAIAVAAVPEGLPAAVSIILAVGMESLLKRGGLVRNLLAAETLGSTTFVLTDKTGTLTQAKMAVAGVIHAEQVYGARAGQWAEDMVARDLFDTALCATAAFVDENEESDTTVVRGDPVESSILTTAAKIDIPAEGDTARGRRIDYLAFTSENRFAAGLTPYGPDFRLCVNGAPELLLEQATSVRTSAGVQPLTDEYRTYIESAIAAATKEGKRLVAVGFRTVSFDDIPEDTTGLLDGLVFLGVVVLADPVRDGVAEAIAGVQGAGARVVLVTGDNPETALSIAQSVGIASTDAIAITGTELERMSDGELLDVLKNVSVFARVLPKQKMRLAQVLQAEGEIVAMTGDGINDAPALQRANIGIAIGSGTAVAKEASDLVLVNDTFATIHAAIEEGRRIIANLRKIVGYLLSTNFSEIILIGTALLVGAPPPILPVQILWANIIEEGLMSVAFAFEKGDKNAMKRKPQDIHRNGVLSRSMIGFGAMVVFVLSSLTLTLYFYILSLDLPIETVRSIMFLSVAMDSLFIAFAFRSLRSPLWRVPIKNNLFFFWSFLISVFLLVAALMNPFMRSVLSYEPVEWPFIVLVVLFSLAALATVEIAKWIFFERKQEGLE